MCVHDADNLPDAPYLDGDPMTFGEESLDVAGDHSRRLDSPLLLRSYRCRSCGWCVRQRLYPDEGPLICCEGEMDEILDAPSTESLSREVDRLRQLLEAGAATARHARELIRADCTATASAVLEVYAAGVDSVLRD